MKYSSLFFFLYQKEERKKNYIIESSEIKFMILSLYTFFFLFFS